MSAAEATVLAGRERLREAENTILLEVVDAFVSVRRDQALVAMAIDAVDIARDAAIDEMVIAGDLTSMLPLVHRLHSAGVRVVLVGPGRTPHDVRAAIPPSVRRGMRKALGRERDQQ